MKRALPPLLLAAMLCSCAVGPDYQPPAPPAETALGAGSSPGTGDIPARWWELYRNPALDRLIEEALVHNADLAAAQAALKVAHEASAANQGVFYPTLQGSFQASRQKDPTATVQPTAANNAAQVTLYTPQLSISYGPDLWGGNRRAQESIEAQERAQSFQTEATYSTLAATVVVTAIEEAGLRRQIAATSRIIELARNSLEILKRQSAAGQVSDQDVAAQEAALAQAEQTLPPLTRQLDQTRHQLTALLGRLPAEEPQESFELTALHLPDPMPAALPSRLVEQRPDIRMADAELQAASAQIGVAIANRLPNITLDGSLGSEATRLQDLFTPGTGLWSASAGLTQPLFDGFTLLHKERGARAAYEQAAAQYRSTVIGAFQNVADCLAALKSDAVLLAA
ncbi:MAG TPA: efflux transporter outer membrane subunit, partial [Magnetospirillaceae bacterium]|nr:efflux transporter outer membrane subunit [Magnetospirillaceae bacterium]